jgi:p-hydroxybenzoate 3-monooxygenase
LSQAFSQQRPNGPPHGWAGTEKLHSVKWTRFDKLDTSIDVKRRATDVVVVGAGPAGLVVAHRLLQANVSCIVIERLAADASSARAKAGMLEHRSVQALRASGLAAPILERGTTNGVVEFRVNGERHLFDYAALTGGRGHFVYPQHLLVQAWAELLLARGGAILSSTEALSVEQTSPDRPGSSQATVIARPEGAEPLALDCRAVVLAAGAGCALVPEGIDSHEHTYPFRWLTTMMQMAPLGERTIYAPHHTGFAAHLRRSAELTRYYLQVPALDHLRDWADDRIRAELELRLGEQAQGVNGPIIERDILDLRVRVREPLQYGCVYLAGDAAHLITPAGGKGMNLAIQDALELSEGLTECFAHGDAARLSRYSETRLPAIWRTQEFSNWMLTLHSGGALSFHRGAPDPNATFARRLHSAQVERLFTDPGFARWFAHRYAGVDEASA